LVAAITPCYPVSTMTRFLCGVPGCLDGRVTEADALITTVECDTHNARTTHDTVERVAMEQQIIRVQDTWRQHGTSARPK
jgi:hypothetical protein